MLAVMALLDSRGTPVDEAALDAAGSDYFGMYRVDWSGAEESLIRSDLLLREGEVLRLTGDGASVAERCRADHPKHLYFYNEYFTRAETSEAHARFCTLVYGRDLCQHGMMDMEQLDALIAALGLGAGSRVLELGCGNGRIAEYISDVTEAHVFGVDSSTVGIRQAIQRTAAKRDRLAFSAGDMAQVPLPFTAFDALVAVDSFYFVADLDGLLERLALALRPGGQMAVTWSSWASADRASLAPEGNRFAQTLQHRGLSYHTLDFTAQEAAHWRRKLEVLRGMEADFASEDNLFLYRKRLVEAESHQEYVEAGMVSRYLYLVRLPG